MASFVWDSAFHPIISCEGTAEQVLMEKLLGASALVFPATNVVEITRKRKANEIQELLNYNFDWPVCVIRILDSRKEQFRLNRLYAERFPVWSFVTHPEIEVLAIVKEGQWRRWEKSRKRPSDFCKQDLGMANIKQKCFLDDYWTAQSIVEAANEYRRLSKIPKGEYCLADLIK